METPQKVKKISIISKIKIKITQIRNKIKSKYEKSQETKSFLSMLGEIILYGLLSGFAYLSFNTHNIPLMFFGFGCGLWLIIKKIVLYVIIPIFSSIRLVSR